MMTTMILKSATRRDPSVPNEGGGSDRGTEGVVFRRTGARLRRVPIPDGGPHQRHRDSKTSTSCDQYKTKPLLCPSLRPRPRRILEMVKEEVDTWHRLVSTVRRDCHCERIQWIDILATSLSLSLSSFPPCGMSSTTTTMYCYCRSCS